MDKYTKTILTIIAVCLLAIVIKLWEPTPAYSGFLGDTVRNFLSYPTTYGDLLNLRNLKGKDRKIERNRIIRNMPLVRVYKIDNTVDVNVDNYSLDVNVGNTVDVNVENTVDVAGSIDCY
jgi:hypothetical protein